MKVWAKFQGDIKQVQEFVINELYSMDIFKISKYEENNRILLYPKKTSWSFISYKIMLRQHKDDVFLVFNISLSLEVLASLLIYYIMFIIFPTFALCGGFINLSIFILFLLTIVPLHYFIIRNVKKEVNNLKKFVKKIKDKYLSFSSKVEN